MPSKLYKILSVLGVITIFAIVFLFWIKFSESRDLKVSFLDVGQGDASLIQTPFGQNIIIDGGPDSSVLEELSKRMGWFDRTIDLMILSHAHDDHVTGLIDVLERYDVLRILYTGATHTAPNYLKWLELVREKQIPMTLGLGPQKINLGEGCYLEILYPFSGQDLDIKELNNTSMVVNLVYGGNNFLFAGDIHEEVEKEIIEKYQNWKVNILKVAHHGSDTSSSLEFLETLNPEIAVISVGIDNPFNHPSKRIEKRFERQGIRIFRTDLNGTMNLSSDGQKVYLNP